MPSAATLLQTVHNKVNRLWLNWINKKIVLLNPVITMNVDGLTGFEKKTLPIGATEVIKANSIRLARTAVFSGFHLNLRHIDERNQRTFF